MPIMLRPDIEVALSDQFAINEHFYINWVDGVTLVTNIKMKISIEIICNFV